MGHLAVRVEATLMTVPPGLKAGGNDKKLEDLKRAACEACCAACAT